MRIVIRLGALTLLLSLAVLEWSFGTAAGAQAVLIRPDVRVSGATRQQLEMTRWAVRRFELAGLEPPTLEIAFRVGVDGCGGNLGFARLAKVDLCTTLVNAMARRAVLHEMGHIWLDQHTSASTRSNFLDLRGLSSWNSSRDPWRLRGYEQGAEILAWALGERILTPQIPDNDPSLIGPAFELLTGRALPNGTSA